LLNSSLHNADSRLTLALKRRRVELQDACTQNAQPRRLPSSHRVPAKQRADHCAVCVRDCFTKLAAPHAAFHATISPVDCGSWIYRRFRYSVPAASLSKPFHKKLE
jgi:hypothetical protein